MATCSSGDQSGPPPCWWWCAAIQHLTQAEPWQPFPGDSGLGTRKADVHLSLLVKSEEPEAGEPLEEMRGSLWREAAMGTWGRGALRLLWSLLSWRLLKPDDKVPWPGEPLLLFACVLFSSSCAVVTCNQRILISTEAHLRTWSAGEWVCPHHALFGERGVALLWVGYE